MTAIVFKVNILYVNKKYPWSCTPSPRLEKTACEKHTVGDQSVYIVLGRLEFFKYMNISKKWEICTKKANLARLSDIVFICWRGYIMVDVLLEVSPRRGAGQQRQYESSIKLFFSLSF